MQWFKHDTNAVNDAKIKKLLLKYGAVGYAIYFHCIELIASDLSETNITFCLEHDSEIIADNLKITGTADKSGIQIVEEVMKYIIELKLFEEKNNLIYCYKLLKRLDSSMTSNSKFRKAILEAKENHDKVMIESCKITIDQNRSDQIKIDQNRIDEIYEKEKQDAERFKLLQMENFETFWSLYDKKVERSSCEKKWKKINPDSYSLIFAHVEEYVKSTPDKQFRKNPETYLNNQCWNDEIISSGNHGKESLNDIEKRLQEKYG